MDECDNTVMCDKSITLLGKIVIDIITEASSSSPSDAPTDAPTNAPTVAPTAAPTNAPTAAPMTKSTKMKMMKAPKERQAQRRGHSKR